MSSDNPPLYFQLIGDSIYFRQRIETPPGAQILLLV